MVGPYVTTLGAYSLAVNAERLLLEDPASHSILSLHPAVTVASGRKPSPCLAVEAFATGTDRMEVTWRPVEGIEAVTLLRLTEARGGAAGPARLELRLRFRNTGSARVTPACLHPLYFPPEGPGALALGREDLRTLASRKAGGPPRLLRLDGADLVSWHFGAWFHEAGSPMLLLAATDGADASLVFRAEGARGKMLALRVDWDAPASLEPGATLETPAIELVMGRADIHEELRTWAARANAGALVPEFTASGEIVVEEPEPIPEPAPEPESEPEPAPEPEPEQSTPPEPQPDAEPEPEAVQEFLPAANLVAMERSAGTSPEAVLPAAGLAWGRGRCAAFHRAMRATRAFEETGHGAWPRWASGRRHQAPSGTLTRTRGYWRMPRPPVETGDTNDTNA